MEIFVYSRRLYLSKMENGKTLMYHWRTHEQRRTLLRQLWSTKDMIYVYLKNDQKQKQEEN